MERKKILIKPKKVTARKPAVKAAEQKPFMRKAKRKALVEKVLPAFGLHMLRAPIGSHKKKKLLGRGPSSGHGKTSTRGSKGQTSRAGRDFYIGFEGGQTPLIRRIPKRGFTSKFKKIFQIVNLSDLTRIKENAITLQILKERNIIKDKNKLVKILGDGDIKNPISIQAHAFSKSASDKIIAAGGKIEIISEAISYETGSTQSK